jgi:hypothetical protein
LIIGRKSSYYDRLDQRPYIIINSDIFWSFFFFPFLLAPCNYSAFYGTAYTCSFILLGLT